MESGRRSVLESSFDYRSLLPTRDPATYEPSDSTSFDNDDADCCSFCPELSLRERLLGCGTCMLAGYLLSMGSFWRIHDLVRGNPYPFVLNATAGNLLALAGSFFLSGPRAQMRKMWSPKRQVATGLYLGSLFLTLFVAFLNAPGPKGFCLLVLMGCQYVSITWYTLSYVPFAHDAIRSFVGRYIGSSSSDY